MRLLSRSLCALVLLSAAGCALTGKADALDVRYFTPGLAVVQKAPVVPAATARTPVIVRMGRLTSGSHLHERLVVRTSAQEVQFDELNRWTERPEAYLARAVARVLFEERRFAHAVSGDAPTLDLELVAFEEVRTPQKRAGRVSVRALLSDDKHVLFEDTITTERPVAPTGATEDFVTAIAEALEAAAEAIADRVANAT